MWRAKGDWNFRISNMFKNTDRTKGPVSQIQPLYLHARTPVIFSDLLRFVHMLKREWGAERNGKLPHLSIPSKTGALVPEFSVEDLPPAELQHWFLSLQWNTCLWAELQPWFPSLQWKTCLWTELQPWFEFVVKDVPLCRTL